MQQDYLIRAMLGDNLARVFALRTTEVVRQAQINHGTSPVASAALGRALTACLVLGAMLKGEEKVTVQIKGDGPLKGIVASADSKGAVKGYVGNPRVELPLNSQGKLAVGKAVGRGTLHVIRDLGLKEAYQGAVPLQSGEIGDDFAYYFTYSEQIPSAVMLGVLIGPDGIPLGSGGIIVQLLPGAVGNEAFISRLERCIEGIPPISSLFAGKQPIEGIAAAFFTDLDLSLISKEEVNFFCDCSPERFEQALITLGREEIEDFAAAGKPLETICHFCNRRCHFSPEHLQSLLKGLEIQGNNS